MCPTGTIREDIMEEKVLSAIIEIKVPAGRAAEIIKLVWEIEKQIETTVALGVGARCNSLGEEDLIEPILYQLGYQPQRAKTNIGLGRATNSTRDSAMTNTLHRAGTAESFGDDYVVFAMCFARQKR